jgi:hypothetical protein
VVSTRYEGHRVQHRPKVTKNGHRVVSTRRNRETRYHTFLDLDGDSGHDILFATFAPPEDVYVIRDLGCPVFLPFVCRNW